MEYASSADGPTVQGPGQGVNFYGAFGDYQKAVRERKFMIAEREDNIANLRDTLKQTTEVTPQLEQKCETLALELKVAEAQTLSETQRKLKLQDELAEIKEEYEEKLVDFERVNNKHDKFVQYESTRKINLENMERDYMERYMKIPEVANLINATNEFEKLEKQLQDTNENLMKARQDLERMQQASLGEWKQFVNSCVELAKSVKAQSAKELAKQTYENEKKANQIEKEKQQALKRAMERRFLMSNGRGLPPMRYDRNDSFANFRSLYKTPGMRYPTLIKPFKNFVNLPQRQGLEIDQNDEDVNMEEPVFKVPPPRKDQLTSQAPATPQAPTTPQEPKAPATLQTPATPQAPLGLIDSGFAGGDLFSSTMLTSPQFSGEFSATPQAPVTLQTPATPQAPLGLIDSGFAGGDLFSSTMLTSPQFSGEFSATPQAPTTLQAPATPQEPKAPATLQTPATPQAPLGLIDSGFAGGDLFSSTMLTSPQFSGEFSATPQAAKAPATPQAPATLQAPATPQTPKAPPTPKAPATPQAPLGLIDSGFAGGDLFSSTMLTSPQFSGEFSATPQAAKAPATPQAPLGFIESGFGGGDFFSSMMFTSPQNSQSSGEFLSFFGSTPQCEGTSSPTAFNLFSSDINSSQTSPASSSLF